MRKLFLLMTMFITLACSAHHIDALGWCVNGKAVFQTAQFANNIDVQVELVVNGPNILVYQYTTPTVGSTAKILTVVQLNRFSLINIRFRYKAHNSSNWGDWSDNIISKSALYVGCEALPLRISAPLAHWVDEFSIDVTFDILESVGETKMEFNLASPNYKTVYSPAVFVMPASTIAGKYTARLVYKQENWIVFNIKPVV